MYVNLIDSQKGSQRKSEVPPYVGGGSPTLPASLKGELHSNYIFLHFALIGLKWDSITLFTKMIFFLPKLTFQHHLYKIYIWPFIY